MPWFSCQILWHPCLLPYYLFILRATLPLPPFTPLPQQSSSVDLCSFHPNNVTHSRGLNSTSWIELVKSVNIIGIFFFFKGKNNVICCGQVRLHRRTRTLRQGKGREGGDVPDLRSRVMPRKRLVRHSNLRLLGNAEGLRVLSWFFWLPTTTPLPSPQVIIWISLTRKLRKDKEWLLKKSHYAMEDGKVKLCCNNPADRISVVVDYYVV